MYILKAIGPTVYYMEKSSKCLQSLKKKNKEIETWHSWHTPKSLTLCSGKRKRGIIVLEAFTNIFDWPFSKNKQKTHAHTHTKKKKQPHTKNVANLEIANALKIYAFHGHLIKKQWIMSQIFSYSLLLSLFTPWKSVIILVEYGVHSQHFCMYIILSLQGVSLQSSIAKQL